MAYCHFELCRACGLGSFSELLLADIRRLSVVAVFLYQITVFFTTQHRHFWNFILALPENFTTPVPNPIPIPNPNPNANPNRNPKP